MAIIQNPIIGRAKNQAGGMVFNTLNGQNVMRAKPLQYRDLNSAVQQKFRALFLLYIALAAQCKFFIRDFFANPIPKMNPFSKVASQLRTAFQYVTNAWVFKPKDIIIGSGNIQSARDWDASFEGDLTIDVTFDNTLANSDEKATDKLYVLLTTASGDVAQLIDSGKTRNDGTATIVVPDKFTGLTGFCSVGAFKSVDSKFNSSIVLSTTDTPTAFGTGS